MVVPVSAASITSEDPRFALVNEQRAACSEKLAVLQRVTQAVVAQRKLVRRWVADFTPKTEETGIVDRVIAIGPMAWERVKSIWAFEVMTFEDKLEVDGQTITGKIPVTLGMLVRAVLFFLVGYWIAARIANRIQNTIVSRGHIAEHLHDPCGEELALEELMETVQVLLPCLPRDKREVHAPVVRVLRRVGARQQLR